MMNLLDSAWIPVRADNGVGPFRLLTYEELLCGDQHWAISLPRDDLELACTQLLVCMTQVIFLPLDDGALRSHIAKPLSPEQFAERVAPFQDWFDLDHPARPFMQIRGVQAKEVTPIQKLLIGLPEGNNHAFFNEVGEVTRLGPAVAAIALFNQAMNCPSFGGGFKGGLRGGAPVTTLVAGRDLRETVGRNVLTLPRVRERLPDYEPDFSRDVPTWIRPIRDKEIIHVHQIGLARGLFWQPAHVELVKAEQAASCDMVGGDSGAAYSGFCKEKFNFTVDGVWPHPHGARIDAIKKGVLEKKFISFTTTAPAWTLLSEFFVPRDLNDSNGKEGCSPAGPVLQAGDLYPREKLHLLVGGYRNKQASILERRHELISLANNWHDNKDRLTQLVELGKKARKILRGQLWFAAQGHKDGKLKGIGVSIDTFGEKLYYNRTEILFYEIFDNEATFKEWKKAKGDFTEKLASICRNIYEELTDPYAHKPELVPIIAWARRRLNKELTEKIAL
ncbi:MAG: type I-E CRISPR-associated protein Cse1/CasA [Candidatus Contendobacter sp.]|nr:type I-E CRISPR-associated protein Cse1/CasA [Candidatus Contendobacter sp.]MDG4556688.1 type I-E CRISPR-associated protein Cse1/CasA [Candidatus Contendobacter sp.]